MQCTQEKVLVTADLHASHMEFSMCSVLKKKCWLQLIYMLGTLMTANKTSQAHFFLCSSEA